MTRIQETVAVVRRRHVLHCPAEGYYARAVTDERIRDYERKASAGRDPVSELRAWVEAARRGLLHRDATALVERMGRGDLARESVELAAYAGHPGALALLSEETAERAPGDAFHVVSRDEVSYGDLRAWLPGLSRWGVRAEILIQLALARLLLDRAARDPAARLERQREGAEETDAPYDYWDTQVRTFHRTITQHELALEAAEELLRDRPLPVDRARVEEHLARKPDSRFGAGWYYTQGSVALAVRSALEGRIVERAPEGESDPRVPMLDTCESSVVPPGAVAAAIKAAIVRFALRRADGGETVKLP